MTSALTISEIQQKIFTIRDNQVMLDSDLAKLYQIETKNLNKAVRRNPERFPEDFMFQLLQDEYDSLRFQLGTLKNGRGEHRKYLPLVFTEQGVAMLSVILKSDRAIKANLSIMRAFVHSRRRVEKKLIQIENKIDDLQILYNGQTKIFLDAIQKLIHNATNYYSHTPSLLAEEMISDSENNLNNFLQNTPPKTRTEKQKIESIFLAVATCYGLEIQELKRVTRTRPIALARQVAIYLIRKHTRKGLKEIGGIFGGKDHTSILYACRKIQDSINQDPLFNEVIESIEKSLSKE